jgi:hypothetical protein
MRMLEVNDPVGRPRSERLRHAQRPFDPAAVGGGEVFARRVGGLSLQHRAGAPVTAAEIFADLQAPEPQRRAFRRIAGERGRRGGEGLALREQHQPERRGRAPVAVGDRGPRPGFGARHPAPANQRGDGGRPH